MTKFSVKLKQLIEDSGINIYQLSKNAELDRTTIQRSITGARLPSHAFVKKLCDYLRLSPFERDELMVLYSIAKVGENTYAGRIHVKKLIEQIGELHLHGISYENIKKSARVFGDIEQEINVISGQYHVNNMLRDLLEEEIFTANSPHISLTIPFNYTYLFDCLQHLYLGYKDQAVIEHIVRLSKNSHNEQHKNVSLEMLSHVLPLAFCIGDGYRPHYYYAAETTVNDILVPMPYYLYTSKYLMTLSADFKTAILFNNGKIKDAYHNEFRKRLTQTVPFIQPLANCEDMVSAYWDTLSTFGQLTGVIEPQPCLARFYTHKLVDDHLRLDVPEREAVKQGLYAFYDRYEEITDHLKSFFSIEGLKHLVATGIMADLPPRYALPFTIEERKHLLMILREDIRKDSFKARLIDPSKFLISSLASIQLYKRNCLMFVAADSISGRSVACRIEEQSIYDAFLDFYESLPDSDLLFCKEDTLHILDEFIEQLGNM